MADDLVMWAGPILRRVEPKLVTVWVALDRPAKLLLTVFSSTQQVVGRGASTTLRLGDKLHIGLVVAEPAVALNPGHNYRYDVGVQPQPSVPNATVLDPATVTPTATLATLGLLADGTVSGRPHKALGYTPGELPGFALPPVALTDLRILHGSCRRPGFYYDGTDGKHSYDGLAFVDDVIAEWRSAGQDARTRPHQLFLTGDQIYADDVDVQMLPQLNRLGRTLIGQAEKLPLNWPPADTDAAKEAYLGAPKQHGFATIREFVAAKLALNENPLELLKRDRRVRALAEPFFDHKYLLLYGSPYAVDAGITGSPRKWEATLENFPAGLRGPVLSCEAKFSSVDIRNHLISIGEYCALYLDVWSNQGWEVNAGKPVFPTPEQVYKAPAQPTQLWDLHGRFKGHSYPRSNIAGLLADAAANERKGGSVTQRVNTLTTFYDSLPRVRRALANVPTYMIFDDHDVTDDWNISRSWRDQVYTSRLGRRIVTGALAAYALFQDWGNDPLGYRAGPYKDVLTHAAALFAPGATEAPFTELEKLFAINTADPEASNDDVVDWHWHVDGPKHRVVGLDTRTRRAYRSRYGASGLLSQAALDAQLPDPATKPLPAGIEAVVVISQTPVAQPSVAGSVIVPLIGRVHERKARGEWRNMTGLEPDNEIWPGDEKAFEMVLKRLAAYKRVVVLSGEVHWGSSAQISYWKLGTKRHVLAPALRAELDADGKALGPGLKTAFFAFSDDSVRIKREGNEEWLLFDRTQRKQFLVRAEPDGLTVYDEDVPAQLAQFTSSGLKNIKALIAGLARGMGFAFSLIDLTPAERLVWSDRTPVPIEPPPGGRFHPAIRDRLGSEPVTVPSRHWPPGTILKRAPDAAWRLDLVRDERPDSQRVAFTRSVAMPGFDNTKVEDSYLRIATKHAEHMLSGKLRFTRGAIYQVNVGLVRFESDAGGLIARHDLISHEPRLDGARTIAVHRVRLSPTGEERPRLRFHL